MTRRIIENPFKGAEEILRDNCSIISTAAKRFELPEPLFDRKCEHPSILGAGEYGIAVETTDDDCVFKLTSDPTEAHFVATAIRLRKEKGVDPRGIVDLRAVFSLPDQHKKQDMFIIWRERATSIGVPKSGTCATKEFKKLLNAFYEASDKALRIAIDEQDNQGFAGYWQWMKDRVLLANALMDERKVPVSSDFSELLVDCFELADAMMGSSHEAFFVGEALRTYLHSGILLCDMHGKNVGIVERGNCKTETFVISDPGHALILKKDLSDVKIPVLNGIH